MEIIGIEKVDYVSKKTGRQVKGINLFLAEEIENGEGVHVDSVFLNESKLNNLPEPVRLGDYVNVYYNRFGTVETVQHVKM